jgi:hypothetical protein
MHFCNFSSLGIHIGGWMLADFTCVGVSDPFAVPPNG